MAAKDPKATPLSQRDLLAIFDVDPQLAEQKYVDLWSKLRRFFEWKQVGNPSDMVQETIVRGLKNLQEGKQITTTDPMHYFFGIARNVAKEGKKLRSMNALDEQELSVDQPDFLGLNRAEQDIYLKECLRELSKEEFDLLQAYIEGATNEWGLARGLQPGAVRLRVHRLRKRIEALVSTRVAHGTKKQ